MRIDIISAVPKILTSPLSESILKRAQKNGFVEIFLHDIRDYTTDKHRTIDDSPYGGGAGMVLMAEPIFKVVEKLISEREYDEIIFLTADGEKFNQKMANKFSLKNNLMLIAGHYKGVDERVRQKLVTKEVSIGDYVLTGGELPAVVLVDAIVRLIPGVIGDAESALDDSFQDDLLGSPQYTRPFEFRNMKVPEILLSGDHKKIKKWRETMRQKKTKKQRKDLLK